ncbi:MAG: cytochrome c biogenesis heme-transporting ATPase CcmA [Methylophagaceae bacterium]
MMLEAKKLTCSRGYRDLFKDLSFDLKSGQLLLVEGENGSGKSTLLKILSGLRQPDNGKMYWNGDEVTFASTNYSKQIVWLSHRNGVNASLTAKENIQVTASLSKSKLTDINSILERVGLKPYANTPVRKFSAGMKRRLALSRLLVNKSKLWILDEPQSALDKIGIALLEGLIEQHVANDGMVVMSSHHDVLVKNVPITTLVL